MKGHPVLLDDDGDTVIVGTHLAYVEMQFARISAALSALDTLDLADSEVETLATTLQGALKRIVGGTRLARRTGGRQ